MRSDGADPDTQKEGSKSCPHSLTLKIEIILSLYGSGSVKDRLTGSRIQRVR